jgi:hypothetical protein
MADRVPAWASGVCAGVHASGSRDVVYVPDNPLSHVLGNFEREFRDVRLLLATREEEAFGIGAGLYLGGRKPTSNRRAMPPLPCRQPAKPRSPPASRRPSCCRAA